MTRAVRGFAGSVSHLASAGAAAGRLKTCGRRELGRRGIENRQEAGLDFLLRRVVNAHRKHVGRRRFAAEIRHPHPLGKVAGVDRVELRQLRFQSVVLLLPSAFSCFAASASDCSRYGLAFATICHSKALRCAAGFRIIA